MEQSLTRNGTTAPNPSLILETSPLVTFIGSIQFTQQNDYVAERKKRQNPTKNYKITSID